MFSITKWKTKHESKVLLKIITITATTVGERIFGTAAYIKLLVTTIVDL